MRSPRLAALELRRFGRGKLPRLGLVALMLIPLLYGALYLCSFWDPYARLDKIPVALVNEDQGATAGGKKITAGEDLTEKVTDSKTFDWQEVSAADAAKGVENGTYYLSLTVPKDFSERIASSSGDAPQTGALQVRTNDANNYVVGSISKTVFSEIRAKTSATSTRGMLDKIFVSFSDLHDKTAEAADGAGKVDKGLGTAKDKTGELADGLGKLDQGSGAVSKGAGQVSDGTTKAASKARQLSQGAGQVADGTQQLAEKVQGIAKKDLPYLRAHGKEIGEKAQTVADLTQRLDEDLSKLPGDSARAAGQARKNADDAAELYRERCGVVATDPDCPKLKAIADGTAVAADAAEKVNDTIGRTDFGQLHTKLRDLHRVAVTVADQAPGIADRADAAIEKINALNSGAHKVSQGAGLLADGINTLADGAGKVADGAGKVHSGLGDAKDGAEKLTGGLFKLKDGSNQLADGLHSGVAKIPDYDKKDRDARTEVMADPVALAAKSLHKAPNYGTGLAPYFIPLSLWVGAMVAFMLLQPLGKRALAAGAPGWRIALGSWLPAYAVGVVQVLALMAVLHWGLGLEMARSGATVGFLLLATACFTALIQLLSAFFGPAGRVLTLVVLMLQLTSAGGTYPVQTSPGFFAAVHPFLPMSYVVDGLRRLITGGDLTVVWQGCAVLAAFTLGALALTALTARGRQVVRMKDLHPELSL
ncbi:YhgE/Pip domain-containing protein [Streptomyces lydicus]|uniref:YhgE/Pip domain-containing protein n=1 Tax=Streptomyces lydicus TaxID=47763 RepID=UPI000527B96F|nr:YhgE/Pip domain-containing protein [Streptomyces lydicus]MDC7338892.1 YhgE/Pip domain-containing protein [Streptomyces lydicus]UEG91620.1 YhgE/Pip domain-containing protein [Streptomyces lydicus]